MTAKTNHITEDLVEQLAIIGYEQTRIQNGDLPMPSWTRVAAMTRFTAKNEALAVLNMVVPVLIELGWKPPTVAQPELKANSKPDQDFEGEYTPSTEAVRAIFSHHRDAGMEAFNTGLFNRWFDRVRAQAKAEALEELANAFQYKAWHELIKGNMYDRLRVAQPITEWLRNRANQQKEEQ